MNWNSDIIHKASEEIVFDSKNDKLAPLAVHVTRAYDGFDYDVIDITDPIVKTFDGITTEDIDTDVAGQYFEDNGDLNVSDYVWYGVQYQTGNEETAPGLIFGITRDTTKEASMTKIAGGIHIPLKLVNGKIIRESECESPISCPKCGSKHISTLYGNTSIFCDSCGYRK